MSGDHFYEKIPSSELLEQGDIFEDLPFLNITEPVINEVIPEGSGIKYKEIKLKDYVSGKKKKNIVIPAKIGPGILISQNCDSSRDEFVSFCAIRPYAQLEKNFSPNNENKQVKFLTKDYAHKAKYFYLPANLKNGFEDRMAVDFSSIHQIKTSLLQELIIKRKCRLSGLALDHFRVKLAHYFRRFAYNPWYVLNAKEFQTYIDSITDSDEKALIEPYAWNK